MPDPNPRPSVPNPGAAFAAIAADYAAWRPHYPEVLFGHWRDRFGLDRTRRLRHRRSALARLGDRQAQFEAERRAALEGANPSGDFIQHLHARTVTATRPS